MARLDLHPMPGPGEGYVADVQAELPSHLGIRVVVPLLPEATVPQPISKLSPVFEIEGHRHVLVTRTLAAVSGRELRRPLVSPDARHDSITRALDLLLVGF